MLVMLTGTGIALKGPLLSSYSHPSYQTAGLQLDGVKDMDSKSRLRFGLTGKMSKRCNEAFL